MNTVLEICTIYSEVMQRVKAEVGMGHLFKNQNVELRKQLIEEEAMEEEEEEEEDLL